MIVKDLKTIWGTPIISLREYSKKHRLMSCIIYLVDVFVMIFFIIAMYKNGASFQVYLFVMLLICLIVLLWMHVTLSPNKWATYKFYRRHKSDSVVTESYNLDAEKFYNILYCSGYKRLVRDKSEDYYKERMLSACCEDYYFARKFMKYMQKYETTEGDGISIYVMKRGNSSYFLDFIESASNDKEVEKEIKDEQFTE